jgi:hypothetical protein
MFSVLLLGLAVSGCASIETATRNAPLEIGALEAPAVSVDVREIRVSVPRALRVSEANAYLPAGDIVWRGDPPGDRHEQVRAIFEEALQRGTAMMAPGHVPVVLEVEVTRFHALTEKARYTVGGVHGLHFVLQLRHAETGALIGQPERIKANLRGFGGQAAIEADRMGQTQKVRITDHLANVIRQELSGPDGYVAANLRSAGGTGQL